MVGRLMSAMVGTHSVVMLPSALVPGISVPSFRVMMFSFDGEGHLVWDGLEDFW